MGEVAAKPCKQHDPDESVTHAIACMDGMSLQVRASRRGQQRQFEPKLCVMHQIDFSTNLKLKTV